MAFGSFQSSSFSSSLRDKSSLTTFGSRSSTNKFRKGQTGELFKNMIKQSQYKPMAGVSTTIKIYLYRKNFHWSLGAKIVMEGAEFDFYVTIELTTSNTSDLISCMREIECKSDYGQGMEYVGEYKGTLNGLCTAADDVVKVMGQYRLFSSNCQHFCNNLLLRIGLKHDYRTTIGPETTILCETSADIKMEEGPYSPDRLERMYQQIFTGRGGEIGASALAALVNAPR